MTKAKGIPLSKSNGARFTVWKTRKVVPVEQYLSQRMEVKMGPSNVGKYYRSSSMPLKTRGVDYPSVFNFEL